MEYNYRKTVIKKTGKAVPLSVWAATGALFLCVLLFAHLLPEAKIAVALQFFNVRRLDRFSPASVRRAPRIVVVGTSLSMCAMYFDEDMERFARENGLPGLEFVRFIKLDGTLKDFSPLLDLILEAGPDAVFFEAKLFVLSTRGDDTGMKKLRFFVKDKGNDDRTKLKAFLEEWLGRKTPLQQKGNPNIPESERKVLFTLRQRQTQDDFERLQEAVAERLKIRPFSVPEEYKAFFDALQQKHIAGVLLDFPRSRQFKSAFPPEVSEAMPSMIKRYEDAYGLRYLGFPAQLGLEYFKDFTHLNERGRIAFSRWFLSELPALLGKGKAS